jgi:glycosyltransferase involved in cell wall biosynthesis
MRVLLLTHDIDSGGASRCVRELFQHLPAQGVQTEAWVAQAGLAPGPRVRCFQHGWERWLGPLEAFPGVFDRRHRGSIRALAKVTRDRFDLVHLHVIHNGCASIRAVYELCQRVPAVWTLHDEWASSGGFICDLRGRLDRSETLRMMGGVRRLLGYSPYHDNFRTRDIKRLLDRWMPRPRVVVTPSQFIADRASASGRFASIPIHVVRNGVLFQDLPEVDCPRDEARQLLGIPAGVPVVLLIAQDLRHAHKGIAYGLRALEQLAVPSLHVLLVGSGGGALRSRVPFAATCLIARDDATLARAYRAADVTLVPSLSEAAPLVATESMACATPVVGFAVGGVGEFVGDDERGLTARPFDTDELAARLRALMEQPLRREVVGKAGRAWVREQFGRDRYFRSILDVYREAVAAEPLKASGSPLDRQSSLSRSQS